MVDRPLPTRLLALFRPRVTTIGPGRSTRKGGDGRRQVLAAVLAALILATMTVVVSSPRPAQAAPAPASVETSPAVVRAASVLSCPAFSSSRLAAAVGVAAVNIGGCPGYWVVNSSGQVDSYGSAAYHGGLNSPAAHIVGIAATTNGGGYWLVGSNGAVYTFGDAGYYGGMGATTLNAPVLGISPTQNDKGYWLVAADGGIFSFGDATFHGSMGGKHLNAPVDGMAVAPGGSGYWLVAGDGGVFTFTTDGFYGSMGGKPLNKPIIGMSGTSDGHGYTLIASDGGVFSFGNSPFYGSLGANPPASPIVDLSPAPANNGYYLVDSSGQVFTFGPGAQVPSTLSVTIPALPTGTVDSNYQAAFAANGGTAPYAWSASGTLPPGLTLAAGGHLQGTPTQVGTYPFDITARDSGTPAQSTTTGITIQINPVPIVALKITTTSLPTGYRSVHYGASLAATGGTGPYTWSITSGSLPTGLALSASGQISGSPTGTDTSDFTVQVQDAAGTTTSAALSLPVATIPSEPSSNWSGYAVTGGPFDAVQGTFTVPDVPPPAEANDAMAEWVGVDGFDDSDLIQAGVSFSPNTVDDDYSIGAWWEILPAAETPISNDNLTVHAGDTVTVALNQASTSTWQISVTDDTTGRNFTTTQSYAGPAESAEWIVEAPTFEEGSQLVQTSMPRYLPSVTFTNLTYAAASGASEVVLVNSSGTQTSTPSTLDANGFSVAYGPTAPPPP